ncbi:MAG: hypothetical protein UX81_C0020G0010 [Parcubacteria group bacterium GW2011_GWA2_47_12]|nr:MAG: hypothetical protein UX81_C0020G0010 [Parcubacteria group bacterium GW2011_GWA2_47_12]
MHKDFDGWNTSKKRIHKKEENKLYHAREIWWCYLGVNIGFEQDGSEIEHRRPVLILAGLSAHTCFALPLTTAPTNHPMRPSIGNINGKKARALLSQLRVIDTKRLVRKIGYLNQETFEHIRKAVKNLL